MTPTAQYLQLVAGTSALDAAVAMRPAAATSLHPVGWGVVLVAGVIALLGVVFLRGPGVPEPS